MTGLEGLEQRGTGVSPVENHGQDAHATFCSPIPWASWSFTQRPPGCDLLDGSRVWNNPVYPVIPSK